jgi:SAM-dependent MidA family methyltransferase
MTLKDHITRRIAAQGPMRLDEYMSTCLLHPTLGYYTTRDPLGATGDFTTAPEISQMFGELIGLALAQCWLDQSAPARFTLAELGPGRGTLMADALRAASKVPGFIDAAEVIFVEASPALQSIQRNTVAPHIAQWVSQASDLPDQPLFLIANEFFDALPIRQFIRSGDQWCERQVGLEDGALVFGLAPAQPQPLLKGRLADTSESGLTEVCAGATPVLMEITQRLSTHGGAALIIDYGEWRTTGDSFQAVKSHQRADPLEAPGLADLTAHVDFEALALAAHPCLHTTLTPQGVFLERLGITARAQSLAARLDGAALQEHIAAHRRLTHPDEMGNLFKVMGLYPPGMPCLPGLESAP